MLKILKSSVRDTIVYSIGTFASKLTGLILVRLYTNETFLSQEDFGVLNLAEANLQIIVSIFGLGLCYAFERWYWDKDYIHKRKSLFFTILVASLLISLSLILICFPFSNFFSNVLFDSSAYDYVFKLMLLCAGLEIVSQTPNSLIRLSERPGLFTTANIGKLFLTVVFTIYFIVELDLGLTGVYYAQLIGIAGYFIILSNFLFQNSELKFDFTELVHMVRFRFPFLLPIIALNLFNFNDRFMISGLIGVSEAGVYSLGAKLANTIKVFLVTAIWLALTPTIYKMMDAPGNKRFYSKVMTYLTFVVVLVVMLFSFFSKEIVEIVSKDDAYLKAYEVIPVISLSILFSMLKDVSLIGLNITKNTKPIAGVAIGVSILNLGLNFLLIRYTGMIGAAFSILISQLIFFIVIHHFAQKSYSIPYEIGKVMMMIAIATGFYFITILFDSLHFVIQILLKVSMIAAYPFVLYFFGFYEKIELQRINGFWRKWRNPTRWIQNIKTIEFESSKK